MGPRSLRQLALRFPSADALLAASPSQLAAAIGKRTAGVLAPVLAREWGRVWAAAEQTIQHQVEARVSLIPLIDPAYPALLKRIADPPAILYALGNVEVLRDSKAVAIVGTRCPTVRGEAVARRVAARFAEAGFVIVSGLAEGVDAAAHQGALDAGGRTVAVLGTAPDRVYPAANRALAERIRRNGGVLVSEVPVGEGGSRLSFVRRDRIQSGLSIAVLPVQTGLDGGTMHTVRFAEAQERLVLCPQPLADEADQPQYAGIWHLIRSGRARAFQAENYADLMAELERHRQRLLAVDLTARWRRSAALPGPAQVAKALVEPEPAPAGSDPAAAFAGELEPMFRTQELDTNAAAFERVVEELRRRLFQEQQASEEEREAVHDEQGTAGG